MSWRKRRHQGLFFIGRAKVRGERERGGNKQPKRWAKAEEEREGSGEGLKQWHPSAPLFRSVDERDCRALRKTCSNLGSIHGGWLVARTVLNVI